MRDFFVGMYGAGLVSEMCCGSLIVWMCIIYIIIGSL